MALIELRRRLFPNNTGVGAAYTAQVIYYDDEARKPYPTQIDSAVNDPRELTKNAFVSAYEVTPGGKTKVVRYDGNGSVYTQNIPPNLPGAGISYLKLKAGPAPFFTSNPGLSDACIDLTGQYGLPPYQLTLRGTTGPATGYLNTGNTSPSELYPVRFYNLREGGYEATVLDALGHSDTLLLTVTAGLNRAMGKLLTEDAHNVSQSLHWSYNGQNVQAYANTANRDTDFQQPHGALIDGYFSQSNTYWRRVYSDGQFGGVYYEDFALATGSELTLHNYSPFHPDSAAEQNGGLVLEMDATHPPLTFQLSGAATQTSATGLFDGLGAGQYDVLVTDQLGKTFAMRFELAVRYGKRWVHTYSDVAGVPCLLELWTAGYTGQPEPIKGQASPVILKTDGLNGTIGGQGDIGPVVTTTAELNLKVLADTFEEIIGKDRYCRCDFYYGGRLHFRGFVQPVTYDAPLLAGLQDVSLTATDGLAGLKDTYMTGNTGQRLYGRRPLLHTLLHCLARTDVALPLHLFTNRREATMADSDAPEQLATTDRTGYWKLEGEDPLFMRDVVEGIAQVLGGTLMQREGTWQVRSVLEIANDHPGRAYRPAGTPAGALALTAPTATIEPPTMGALHWLEADQVKQVRAGWKSLTGKTDVGWLKNAYPQGGAFSDKYAWLDDLSQLRAVSGWRPAAGTVFPLLFGKLGEKGGAYATKWPRSGGYSTFTPLPYLQGPALPLAPGLEAVPATLQFTGRFVPAEYWFDSENNKLVAPTNGKQAVLTYEVVVDGQGSGQQFVTFELGDSDTAKDITVSAPLPALPSGAVSAELRLYTWYAADTLLRNSAPTLVGLKRYKKGDVVTHDFGNGDIRLYVVRLDDGFTTTATNKDVLYELTPTNGGLGTFYLSEVAVQLTPQNATWEGEDNFRADGPGGDIRPTETLEVLHPDVPLAAGLYGGNLPAFSRGVALSDGTMSTSWKRHIDLDAAPLFEANIYDVLQLRDGKSSLLVGMLQHAGTVPPLLLDTLDAPFDVPGRRFAVGSSAWNTKLARTEVSLVQNGVGASATNPYGNVSGKILVTDLLYQWLPGQFVPYALGTDDGSLLSWD